MRALLLTVFVLTSTIPFVDVSAASFAPYVNDEVFFPNEWAMPHAWPPQVTVARTDVDGLDCAMRSERIENASFSQMEACRTIATEETKSATYRSYEYTLLRGGELITIEWGARYVRCSEYAEPIRTECEDGHADADPDEVVKSIVLRMDMGLLDEGGAWFSDVLFTHPNAAAISYARYIGLVQGYPDGTFRPDVPMNRAEFAKIIVSYEYGDEAVKFCPQDARFVDVPEGEWFFLPICGARLAGFVGGHPDGTFRPADNVNVAEAAKILSVLFRKYESDDDFVMRDGDPWFAPYVRYLSDRGMVPTSIHSVDQPLTRGEFVEIFRRWNGVSYRPSMTYEELMR